MPPTLQDRLHDILQAIDDINSFLIDRTQEDLKHDRQFRLALERGLEIVSEASRHIPDDIKARNAQIPWERVADLGNWLRHVYHRVDMGVLWNIATNDLAVLKSCVEQLLQDKTS